MTIPRNRFSVNGRFQLVAEQRVAENEALDTARRLVGDQPREVVKP
ncbi:hypothetical protein [Modestobacter italicus]|nr:hypothetical protein [Modestobacter marinus]